MGWFVTVLEVSPICHSSVQRIYYVSMLCAEEVDIPPRQIHLHLFIASHCWDPDYRFGEQDPILFSITSKLPRALDGWEMLKFRSSMQRTGFAYDIQK